MSSQPNLLWYQSSDLKQYKAFSFISFLCLLLISYVGFKREKVTL